MLALQYDEMVLREIWLFLIFFVVYDEQISRGEANPFDILLFCVLLLYSKPKFNYRLFAWDISIQVLILPCFWAHFVTLNTFQRYFDIRNQVIWSSVLYSEQPVSGQILKGPSVSIPLDISSALNKRYYQTGIKVIGRQEKYRMFRKRRSYVAFLEWSNIWRKQFSESLSISWVIFQYAPALQLGVILHYLWEIIDHIKEQRIWFRRFCVLYVMPKIVWTEGEKWKNWSFPEVY